MKKVTVFILAMLMLATLFAGCQASANGTKASSAAAGSSAPAADPAKKVKIGISLGSNIDVFDRLLYEGMKKYQAANSDKIETIVTDAKGDPNTQLSNVDQLINSKVDVIVLWPYEVEPLTPAVEKANAANIPVVCVNSYTSGGKYVYVGSDDVEAGRIQGAWLEKNLPKDATFCYVMGVLGHSGQIGRKQGLQETLMKNRTDVKMLAEQSSQWAREKALTLTEDWLKSFPTVTAVVCQNDNSALGAIEAARTAGKLKDLIIVGVDATEEACEKIKEGEMAMSVFQNADLQGQKSMEVALQIVQGTWTGGEKLIIPFEAVDKTNVDDFLARYKGSK